MTERFDDSQRRQRNALIGLTVGSALVLSIGVIASFVSGSDGSAPQSEPSTSPTIGSVTTDSTTTTTTTTTVAPTTTIDPADVVADAGPDLAVDAGQVVTLDAAAVTPGVSDGDVRWRQSGGPDVTSGVGALDGRTVSFSAPDDVVTLSFELVVGGGTTGEDASDPVVVRVFEDAEHMAFVDAERGDDAAEGTMGAPKRTIVAAAALGGRRDVYVRSVGVYEENEAIRLGSGSSLYGGFDENWDRDPSQPAEITGATVGIVVSGGDDRRVSAVELTAGDGEPGVRSVAIRVAGAETVRIDDSRLVSGAGGAAGNESVGVLATDAGAIVIERSTVNASSGGTGAPADEPERQDPSIAGTGQDATGRPGGDGGESGGGSDAQGGADGGRGGTDGGGGSDGGGPDGGFGGTLDRPIGRPGSGGTGGTGGSGGDGGDGLDVGDAAVVPVGAAGAPGGVGDAGTGGSGGGGGAGIDDLLGAGGGGGGAGGDGGVGSPGGGGGGGGSIGIWAVDVDRVVIRASLIAGARGGDGAMGAAGSSGAAGGDGGDGAEAPARGGGGGGGGAGGNGGQSGGGAGGPSYGVLSSMVGEIEISSSTVRGGAGGDGANGGSGANAGSSGGDASGRSGGDGGETDGRDLGERGVGASGGSSYGWFDEDGARQTLDDAEFDGGFAGRGGDGSTPGQAGAQSDVEV